MTTYLIECSFALPGCKHKSFAWVERDSERTGKLNTAQDIAFGQVENVERVIGFHMDAKDAWGIKDCTKDIAEEVAELCMTEYGRIPERLRDFIDEHVGLQAEVA